MPWLIPIQSIHQSNPGKFAEAQALFDALVAAIPLVVVDSRAEAEEVKELLGICREYKTAIRLKAAIAELPADDAKRQIELAAYFTHCALQPAHLLLALRMAMVAAFKFGNYITAAAFAHRLLELPDMASERNAELRTKAQKARFVGCVVVSVGEGEGEGVRLVAHAAATTALRR